MESGAQEDLQLLGWRGWGRRRRPGRPPQYPRASSSPVRAALSSLPTGW